MRFASGVQLVLLGLVTAVGIFATAVVAADWLRGLATWSWAPATCTIERSQAVARPEVGDYDLELAYHYRYRGQQHSGEALSHEFQGLELRSQAEVLASRYPPGAEVPCWVDPEAPERAYLQRSDLWRGLWILVPLVFVAVGAGGLWLFSTVRTGRGPGPGAEGSPHTAKARPALGAGLMIVAFGLFALFGAGFLFPFFVQPALQVLAARSWTPVPCEILSSRVLAHAGDEGDTTYSIDVLYRYEIGGREYRANRYQFLGGSSSGYAGKAKVVRGLAEGTRTTCWVDPADPFSAVIERGLSGGFLFGLVPLLFTLIGAGGLVFAIGVLRGARRDAARPSWSTRSAQVWSPTSRQPAAATGPMVLEPLRGPLARLGCAVLGALFWNGFIAVFVWHVVAEWRAGNPQWMPALILTPFVLIGLLLLSGIPYSLLALLNPRPRVHLASGTLRAGEAAQLEWAFRGLAGRLRGLRIWLEATETVTRQTDTSLTMESRELDTPEIEILHRGPELPLDYGAVSFTVPAGTPPTADGDRAVRWKLRLHGEIGYWPDVDESYEVRVLPAGER